MPTKMHIPARCRWESIDFRNDYRHRIGIKTTATKRAGPPAATCTSLKRGGHQQLSFEERLGLLIDRQWYWRENRELDRRLRTGRLQGPWRTLTIERRADWTGNWCGR